MHRSRFRLLAMIWQLLFTFLLAACGSTPASHGTASTPVPKITPPVPRTTVHFLTQDHLHIAGWLYGNGGTTAIICSHESRGDKSNWSDTAPWFANHGFMVLAFDF